MITDLAPKEVSSTLEKIIVKGNLNELEPMQRVQYYLSLCEVTGLNPLTQPFAFIAVRGELKLYALKSCTDQLRKLHGVHVTTMVKEQKGDLFVVSVEVMDRSGRVDQDVGVVPLTGLTPADAANAIMKAVTKAKRRATLSICGLSLLDESELDTMSRYTVVNQPIMENLVDESEDES